MRMPQSITESELIAYAVSEGARVTPAQLKRWRQAKLLPPVTRRGLGRAAGTETRYPPEAIRWTVDLWQVLQADRNLDRAAWRLWLKGYPLTEKARAYLMAVATALEGGLYRLTRGDFDPPGTRRGVQDIPEVRASLLAMTGQPQDDDAIEALDRLVTESPRESGVVDGLDVPFTFDGLSPHITAWREALAQAPADVLLTTRDQVLLIRTVLGFVVARPDVPPTPLLFLAWFATSYVSGFGTALLDGISLAVKRREVPQMLEEARPLILGLSAAWRRLYPQLSEL